MRNRLAALALAAVVLIADQASKFWVLHGANLTDGHILVLLPVLNFVLVWNRGITFGLFTSDNAGSKLLLAAVALIVIAALFVWLWRARRASVALCAGAIAGGAIGNVADRLRYGAVVDFIQAHLGAYSWYVFNVGDAAIVCGVLVLMAESLLRPEPAAGSLLQPAKGGDRKAP
jgi:signal peptidase II